VARRDRLAAGEVRYEAVVTPPVAATVADSPAIKRYLGITSANDDSVAAQQPRVERANRVGI
jgi:hypothetical protein